MPGSAVVPQPIRVPARSVEALGTGLFFGACPADMREFVSFGEATSEATH